MRWPWTEGPTQGQVYEHIFHQDGTVEWREVGASPDSQARSGVNFATRVLVGFASGEKQRYPLRGTFEMAGRD